jgi:phosphate/sulfate permease
VSSAAVWLGHGTNDAQKTMGVIAALLVATGPQAVTRARELGLLP